MKKWQRPRKKRVIMHHMIIMRLSRKESRNWVYISNVVDSHTNHYNIKLVFPLQKMLCSNDFKMNQFEKSNINKSRKKNFASPGNRTRISSLEGSHDNHYTRDAIEFKPNKETYIDYLHCYSFLWTIIIFSFFHRHQFFLPLLYGSAYLQKSLLHFSFVMTHE